MRAFAFVWIGLIVSLVGSGLTAFSLGVWIFLRSDSTTQYALVIFCAAVPPLVVLPLAGPLIDRWDRKRLLIGCDLAGAAATAAVGLLAWTGTLSLVAACVIVAFTSSVGALQFPAYSAVMTRIVPREQLGRASGMTNLAQATSQIVAPVVAGTLVVSIGLAGITALDFLSFLFSALMLSLAAIPGRSGSGAAPASYFRDLPFGWSYIFSRSGLAALLVMFAVVNFFAELASVLFTPLVLGIASPAALGTLLSLGGAGMIAGSAIMSVWGGPRRPALGAALFAGASGLAVAAAGMTSSVAWLGVAAFVFFFTLPLQSGSSQVIWQRTVPPDLQGRVFSARVTLAMSAMPLASLVAGPLADRIFEPLMARGGGLAPLFGALVGVGPKRGIAVILVLSGAASVAAAVAAALFQPLRSLDDEGARSVAAVTAEVSG